MDFPDYVGLCAIADAGWAFMALNQNGTVTSDSALPYFASWMDVVEIAGGYGVKADGSIVTEKEFCQEMTPEQLAQIRTWRVMVDPEPIPAGKPARNVAIDEYRGTGTHPRWEAGRAVRLFPILPPR